jgi:hypothetical protein
LPAGIESDALCCGAGLDAQEAATRQIAPTIIVLRARAYPII